jgi:hypothetical protein
MSIFPYTDNLKNSRAERRTQVLIVLPAENSGGSIEIFLSTLKFASL